MTERSSPLDLSHFLPMARDCAKDRTEAHKFNFAALVELLEARESDLAAENSASEREARMGRLLSEAMAEILLTCGDCAHVPASAMESSCASCRAVRLCDEIWAELRSESDGDRAADDLVPDLS